MEERGLNNTKKDSKRQNVPQVRQVALKGFGYESLRPGQETAILAVMDGHDTLVVMPWSA